MPANERARPGETSGRGDNDARRPDPGQMKKFRRGAPIATKAIPDLKLRSKLKYTERLFREAQEGAARVSEWLLPADAGSLEAEGMEETWRFKQADILNEVGEGVRPKIFDLDLPTLGPYRTSLTRNGRHLLLGGRKGHLAMMDWQRKHLVCEVQVAETTHDVCFLHNETLFAAAQRTYCYVYDKRGTEVHCLKDQMHVRRLTFLPHHFLLASIGAQGILTYQDTSVGTIVAQHKTKQGACDVMTHNPYNAVVLLGHANGTVHMWTPNITSPVVKMLCHKGPVRAVAVDPSGRYMVSAGADRQVKVWDVRTFKSLHDYNAPAPASSLCVSQRGMLSLAYGRRVQVWNDALGSKATSPYLNHMVSGAVATLAHVPYEDVLVAGHAGGISTVLVPGSGEPNYDSLVADPYAGKRARQEAEVGSLLDKLQASTIVLDPEELGRLRQEPGAVAKARQEAQRQANAEARRAALDKSNEKKRMKGKNKPSRRAAKKQRNVIEERKPQIVQRMQEQSRKREREVSVPEHVPEALHRFFNKRQAKV